MAVVIDLIREFSPWIYGACAIVALWYLRVVLVARRERRSATFALEREQALNRVFGAWGAAFGIILVMGAVYAVSTVVFRAVEPQLTADQPTATPAFAVAAAGTPTATPTLPEPDVTATPTATAKPARPTRRPTNTPAPTQPTPVATPAPQVQRPRCPTGNAVISSPGVGEVFSGPVAIFGTANIENFQFYKLEYGAGENPAVWSYFGGGDSPVVNGRLGTLNVLPPGAYSVRVVAVDQSGNFPLPCQTTITFR
jgi:hypothetical protein